MNISIDDVSSQWTYNPPVCADYCDGSQTGIPASWWQLANQRTPADMAGFYDLTETATDLIGATATLTFHGSAIYYYGNVAPWAGVMAVSLDGVRSTVNNTIGGTVEYRQSLVWWKTGLDPSAQHTLIVTVLDGTYIDVDRVVITQPTSSTTSQSSTMSLSASLLSLPSEINSGGGSSSNGTGSVLTPSQHSKSNLGAIVGGVVGGIALLTICVLLTFCFTRRSRHQSAITAPLDGTQSGSRSMIQSSAQTAPYSGAAAWQPSHGQNSGSGTTAPIIHQDMNSISTNPTIPIGPHVTSSMYGSPTFDNTTERPFSTLSSVSGEMAGAPHQGTSSSSLLRGTTRSPNTSARLPVGAHAPALDIRAGTPAISPPPPPYQPY